MQIAAGRAVRIIAAAIPLALLACGSLAQNYPTRPIRIIVPYPPGGAADNVARVISPGLTEALGQQILIDNRGGAAGVIGAELVARSAPDGYTLLDDASAHVVNPALRKLPFDTLKDFAPVGMMMRSPNLLVSHLSLPVKSVRDLIALAKARPGEITFASAGIGSAPHMAGELFKYLAKVNLVHVPYKGGGPVFSDLLGGHVQLFFGNIAGDLPYVKSGKLRGIAVTSAERSRSAPEIPTMAEAGVPGYELFEWNALFAPAGTPPAIVAMLNAAVRKVIDTPDVQQRFFQFGAESAAGTPEQLGSYVRAELAKWEKVVRDMNIKVE